MIKNKKIVVVLPAYNAGQTLEQTYNEIPFDIVDDVILVDDFSRDNTVEVGKKLGIKNIIVHEKNKGYGGNQKSCYNKALELGADIVIMLHPDYQYTPKLIESMSYIIANDVYPVVLQPNAYIHAEPAHAPETVGIPHRLPRIFGRSAPRNQLQRQFRRLCV